MVIRLQNELYIVTEFQHITPGKGQAVTRTKLKNVTSGRVIENTFRASDKLDAVRLVGRKMQYLYNDGTFLYLQDAATYEQTEINVEMLGSQMGFLKEGNEVIVLFNEETAILAELPITVELEVTRADPVARGNTAGNLTNEVELETGAKINVPPFVKTGDILKIDTRTGAYISRV